MPHYIDLVSMFFPCILLLYKMGNKTYYNRNVPKLKGIQIVKNKFNCPVDISHHDPNQLVIYLKTKSCRLLHGSFSWFASGFVNITHLGLQDPLQHWWIIIQTNKNYYIIQFYADDIYTMTQCQTENQCDMNGLECANSEYNADIWTQELFSKKPKNDIKLGDIVEWLKGKSFSSEYRLYSNNCQDLCKAVFTQFT